MTLTLDQFRTAFETSANEIDWEVCGFAAPSGKIYPFGTDTKVLSTVFELLSSSIISEIAKANDYVVEGSVQTVYPDFTLSPTDGTLARIAIDIKTTYRRFTKSGDAGPIGFTLGSYTSFLRGSDKNIKYPYAEYSEHWVLGFVYTRRKGVAAKLVYDENEIGDVPCPYEDVEFFIQDKYKIAGLRPGSGNTANIASFPATIDQLKAGTGPFSAHGKQVCDGYWRNYPKGAANRVYGTVEEYLEWQAAKDDDN